MLTPLYKLKASKLQMTSQTPDQAWHPDISGMFGPLDVFVQVLGQCMRASTEPDPLYKLLLANFVIILFF